MWGKKYFANLKQWSGKKYFAKHKQWSRAKAGPEPHVFGTLEPELEQEKLEKKYLELERIGKNSQEPELELIKNYLAPKPIL